MGLVKMMPAARPPVAGPPGPSYAPGYEQLGNMPYRSAYGLGGSGGIPVVAAGPLRGGAPQQSATGNGQMFQPVGQQMGQPSQPAYNYASQYNATPAYRGAMATTPYGEANSMTWGAIGNALGMSSDAMGRQLMGLSPGAQAAAAAFAQHRLGVPVPGDGQQWSGIPVPNGEYRMKGVPMPPGPASVMSAPSRNVNPASSYGGTLDAIRQRLGSAMPAAFR